MKLNANTFTTLAVIAAAGLSINYASAAANPGGRTESGTRAGTSLPADGGYQDGRLEPNGPSNGIYHQSGQSATNGRTG